MATEIEITDKVLRVCEVKLTSEEYEARTQQSAECKLEQSATEEEKAREDKKFKAKIDGLNLEVGRLSRIIKNRAEDRNIECIRHYHKPRRGRTCVIRPDTGEQIEEREMTESEIKDYDLRFLKAREQELPGIPVAQENASKGTPNQKNAEKKGGKRK